MMNPRELRQRAEEIRDSRGMSPMDAVGLAIAVIAILDEAERLFPEAHAHYSVEDVIRIFGLPTEMDLQLACIARLLVGED